MGRNILVPLDGSALSEQALPFAVALTRPPDDHLLLLRVVTEGRLQADGRVEGPGQVVHAAESYLTDVTAHLAARATPHVYVDEPALGILHAIEALEIHLLVMSTHGRSGVGQWLYGSVANDVLRKARTPILLVPSICESHWSAGQPSRIVVPLDGSRLAEEGLGVGLQLARELNATVILLQVIEPPAPLGVTGSALTYGGSNPEVVAAAAQTYLNELARRVAASGVKVETIVRRGHAAATIADSALEQKADLLAMATHGRSGLARLTMGSVANDVLRRATTPVLLARPTILMEQNPMRTGGAAAALD